MDSTNRYARALAADGAAQGTLVVADEQTAGRGRRGRGWVSPAGEGIFMTLILRPQAHPSHVARLSLQTALAVARAIARVCEVDARIKWPNDIVCGGKKVCGMLLEMNADEQSVHDVVAGIGINVRKPRLKGDCETASSLDLLTGKRVCRADVVRAFWREYGRWPSWHNRAARR
ncbi:MAG: biotin--[acetyl-CoA-carboxylase] ligase [Christensenellales bacterium]